MITSFIFVSEGIGYQYGIGKYVACLKKEFAGKSDIAINVVVLGSKNSIEMTIEREAENINMVYLPFFGGNNEQERIKTQKRHLVPLTVVLSSTIALFPIFSFGLEYSFGAK